MRKLFNQQRAFTVIELLVVILIIGILIAVAAPSFLGNQDKAYNSETKQQLTVLYKHARLDFTNNEGEFTTNPTAFVNMVHDNEPQLAFSNTATPTKGQYGLCKLSSSEVVLVGKGKNDKTWTLTTNSTGARVFGEEDAGCIDYQSEVMQDNPWVYLRFNPGQLAEDSSGNNRDLGLVGSHIQTVPGPVKTSGPDDALQLNGGETVFGLHALSTASYTLESWVRVDNHSLLAYDSSPIQLAGVGAATWHGLWMRGNNVSAACGPPNLGVTVYPMFAYTRMCSGGWASGPDTNFHHYVLSYDAVAGQIRLYIDGTLFSTTARTSPGVINFNRYTIYTNYTGVGAAMSIDELAVYPYVLGADRVQAHYDSRED